MFKNKAGQFATFFAFDPVTGLPKGNIGSTITAYVEKDDSQNPLTLQSQNALVSNHQVGYYDFALTIDETNANKLLFTAESTDPNTLLVGVPPVIYTISTTTTIPSANVTVQVGTYQSPAQVDAYAQTKLHTDGWDSADEATKLKIVYEATRRIDVLSYISIKIDSNQLLEFPRKPDTDVPVNILKAHSEIAIALADNDDLDTVGIISERFAAVGITYDVKNIPIWKRIGIPSEMAWLLLSPYLRLPGGVTLRRVS